MATYNHITATDGAKQHNGNNYFYPTDYNSKEQDQAAKVKLNNDLRRACDDFQIPRIKYLIRLGADPDHRDFFSEPAIHIAVVRMRPEVVKALVEAGADINLPDCYGHKPLGIARAWKSISEADLSRARRHGLSGISLEDIHTAVDTRVIALLESYGAKA